MKSCVQDFKGVAIFDRNDKDNIDEIEKQTNLKETDLQLLRELKRLHSELTGEEIRTGKVVRDNKTKERELDKQKREDDQRAIL